MARGRRKPYPYGILGKHDDDATHDLERILTAAHARLDERDHRNGTYLPPELRARHIPRHHEAWHQ